MLWFNILIPIIGTLIAYKVWHHKITIAELFVPVGVSLIVIVISYLALKEVNMRDVEYNGQLITEARYYEPWETWVPKTCSEQYPCGTYTTGTPPNQTTHTQYCTRYYDCSYCDDHSARYVAIADDGTEISIDEEKYKQLIAKWSATPTFVELDRDINYEGSCGRDGNMYYVRWNNNPATSEAFVRKVEFQNPVKVSHSAFKFPEIPKDDADSMGLYHYPEFYDGYKQSAILCRYWIFPDSVYTKFEYLNGYMGPRNKVKIFTLIYKDKPIDISFRQEQYWEGGNQNELIVCVGVDKNFNIEWVRPFSWCDNKRITVNIREDIAELNYLYLDSVYTIYQREVPLYFHYKSFKDFNYLHFEPTAGQIWCVYIITILVTIACIVFTIKNQIDPS